jgi:leucine dehydrogenase
VVFGKTAFAAHEKVLFCTDAETGLQAIIAIHSTRLGPAAGGCRMFPYASEADALDDVLRLSRAMTYKNALAGLRLGGGKSVILGDPAGPQAAARLTAFGKCIDALGGAYWTAEDVGVNLDGVEQIAKSTRFVFGTRSGQAATGDPSAFTARGVYAGLRAAVRHRLGRDSIAGLRVAVQGVGSVGWELCRQLRADGAALVVADRNADAAARASRELGAEAVAPDVIHQAQADVFAPCALGGTLNAQTVPELKASVVAGAANNPLQEPADGAALRARGVLYAPDFIVNAGGMMHASGEIFGAYDEAAVTLAIEGIYDTVLDVCRRADLEDTRPELVAIRLAEERLAAG